MSIDAFQKLLHEANNDDPTIVKILRSLTKIEDSQALIGDTPSPLGAWSGWS